MLKLPEIKKFKNCKAKIEYMQNMKCTNSNFKLKFKLETLQSDKNKLGKDHILHFSIENENLMK